MHYCTIIHTTKIISGLYIVFTGSTKCAKVNETPQLCRLSCGSVQD